MTTESAGDRDSLAMIGHHIYESEGCPSLGHAADILADLRKMGWRAPSDPVTDAMLRAGRAAIRKYQESTISGEVDSYAINIGIQAALNAGKPQ